MQSIIRQNGVSPALPDFRNLGTILRILVAVNGVVAVAALLRDPSWETWPATWTDMVAAAEPQLLLQLAALYLLQPWLSRQTFSLGATTILGITVLTGIGVYLLLARSELPNSGGLLRYLVFGLLAAAALIGYFRLRARALSPAITEARLQALQARIRPHFLFNSINAVLSLVRTDPKRAETSLEDMADLFRVLMRDNRELAPLADEVLLCRQYLALEKLRLGERLVVEWHTNNMPSDALVPPLILQPLLENAVYHGIEPSTTPGVVSINIFYKGGDVHAILRNPYLATGGQHHAGNKMALANVRERLALHFNAEAALESRVKADAYEVHLRVPYRAAKHSAPHVETARPRGADARGAPPDDPEAPIRRSAAHG
jgi:two-component system sensor histidine kinase AlgZ